MPLRNESAETIGFIWADDPSDRLLPSPEKLRVLRMFANQAVTALELARRWAAEQEANELMRATVTSSPLAIIRIDRDGNGKHARVDRDFTGPRREPADERRQHAGRPRREDQAEQTAGERKDRALRQQLTNQTAPTGAQTEQPNRSTVASVMDKPRPTL